MTHPITNTDTAQTASDSKQPEAPAKKTISMHEGVPTWHDCCCCEAEPRWVAVAEELSIDLDADWNSAAERARSG